MAVEVNFLIEELPNGQGIKFTNQTNEDGTTPISYELTLFGNVIDITGWVMNVPLEISSDAFPSTYIDDGVLKDGAYEFKLTYLEGANTHDNTNTYAFIAQINRGYVLQAHAAGGGVKVDFYDHKALKMLEVMEGISVATKNGQIATFQDLLILGQKLLKIEYDV
jgi:hypothetical protein